MRAIVLMLAQTATVTVPPGDGGNCAASTQEIVVCGQRRDPARYRLPASPTAEPTGPPRAEWGLGGGVRAGVSVSQKALQQGVVSNRVMATVKIPF